ncbi:uncharacterized protein ZBAI_09657 [Zygosaccharomyces bailii ISA1307]|nr:uncharacterized protein ZBAI_09657 [Zygosaccharomyces bailii ISA1307]
MAKKRSERSSLRGYAAGVLALIFNITVKTWKCSHGEWCTWYKRSLVPNNLGSARKHPERILSAALSLALSTTRSAERVSLSAAMSTPPSRDNRHHRPYSRDPCCDAGLQGAASCTSSSERKWFSGKIHRCHR